MPPPAVLVVLFLVYALLSPREAVAGPPEKVSGAMKFDSVTDGLKKYRKMTDLDKRQALLERLAATRDPRVDILLGELLSSDEEEEVFVASGVLLRHHFPQRPYSLDDYYRLPRDWWKGHEADLRRRARQLPGGGR